MENANSTICAGLEPGDGESLVSWQSAWFAVVAIAMNSMSSPNGKVLGFPSSWGEVLRSSPLICFFDALELSSFWLFVMVFNREGPCVAARRVVAVRFNDCESDQIIGTVRSRFWITQVGFSIAVLTQAIKLFAMRGVIGCQVCALFYLYSWTLSQALMLCASYNITTSLPLLRPGPDGSIISQGLLPYVPLHAIGVISHIAWLYGLQDEILHNSSFNNGIGTIVSTVLLVLFSVVIPFYRMGNIQYTKLTAALTVPNLIIHSAVAAGMFKPWNIAIDAFFRDVQAVPSLHKGDNWGLPIETDLSAFTLARQTIIGGILPLVFLFIHATLVAADRTIYARDIFGFSLQAWMNMIACIEGVVSRLVQSVEQTDIIFSMWWKTSWIMILPGDWALGSDKTASFEMVGACFIGANLVWPLLWFWKVWGDLHPECTAKPGWTEYLG
ncbi:hypothetical protein GGR51DRAFT_33747 [Nemania sp. FL0031]|nr:hypothetical protein GGR51DRAFT_33747 [Nemania sp. FL0031]